MQRVFLRGWLAIALACSLVNPAHADPLQAVSKRLAKGLTPIKPKRIAVLPFPYHNGDVSSGSSIVSERLVTLMVMGGQAEIIERALLDKTLSEIRLGMTGIIDPSTTQKLGKILGVKAIVTGTLIDLDDGITEVNARLIETETGSILAAATAQIRRSWDDLPRPAAPTQSLEKSEEETKVHSSKLISNSGPRVRATFPIYNGPLTPTEEIRDTAPANDVLTLTDEDLVPMSPRARTEPGLLLNEFMTLRNPSPQSVHIARRIYHRNPDPQIRARALLAMGHLLERSGQRQEAARAYSQVLQEFPDAASLQQDAQQRLNRIASSQ